MSANYLRKYRVKGRFRRFKAFLALFMITVAFLIVIFLRNASAVLVRVSEATARSYITLAVADAVEDVLLQTQEYASIITVTRSEDGDITDIIANAAVINVIARRMAYSTQKGLDTLSSHGVDIPIGAFTGIVALYGFGYKINFKIIPVSTVVCSFVSRFTTAGINQTLHSLYLQVDTAVNIVTPSKTINVNASDEVLLCESVIVGKIPDYILGSGLLNYNGVLVPQSGN